MTTAAPSASAAWPMVAATPSPKVSRSATADVALIELLKRRVHVESAAASGIVVLLSEPTKKKESKPFSLEPPIDVLLDEFTLEGAPKLQVPLVSLTQFLFADDGRQRAHVLSSGVRSI